MARQCPPGVICIENITLLIITVLIIVLGFIIFCCKPIYHKVQKKEELHSVQFLPTVPQGHTDILLDPYAAPLRDDRYFLKGIPFLTKNSGPINSGIPINVMTQAPGGLDSEYRQVGILTRKEGGETILPLMGRPLLTHRDKWNFYSLNDKNNMIKVPIKVNGKSASSEYGCDNIFNGDSVYVEGYNQVFKATIYDNQVQRYLPFL